MFRSEPRVRHNPKALFGLRRGEMGGYSAKGFIADIAPVDACRSFLIPPVNIGEALGIAGLNNVQDVIRLGRLEKAAHPLPAFDRVEGFHPPAR